VLKGFGETTSAIYTTENNSSLDDYNVIVSANRFLLPVQTACKFFFVTGLHLLLVIVV